jgi:hypothetical protein
LWILWFLRQKEVGLEKSSSAKIYLSYRMLMWLESVSLTQEEVGVNNT